MSAQKYITNVVASCVPHGLLLCARAYAWPARVSGPRRCQNGRGATVFGTGIGSSTLAFFASDVGPEDWCRREDCGNRRIRNCSRCRRNATRKNDDAIVNAMRYDATARRFEDQFRGLRTELDRRTALDVLYHGSRKHIKAILFGCLEVSIVEE